MKTFKSLFLLLIIGFTFSDVQAQDPQKPKVALVLSGGGAKGVAHIPLLQTLDSLGIIPDLIVGGTTKKTKVKKL